MILPFVLGSFLILERALASSRPSPAHRPELLLGLFVCGPPQLFVGASTSYVPTWAPSHRLVCPSSTSSWAPSHRLVCASSMSPAKASHLPVLLWKLWTALGLAAEPMVEGADLRLRHIPLPLFAVTGFLVFLWGFCYGGSGRCGSIARCECCCERREATYR